MLPVGRWPLHRVASWEFLEGQMFSLGCWLAISDTFRVINVFAAQKTTRRCLTAGA